MPQLIHLNGPPGAGKSTIAALYAATRPRVLNLDADDIVKMIGGWEDDFFGTVDLVRPLAISMAKTHLEGGHDVVMPQLVADRGQRQRFVDAAESVGGVYREIVLLAPRETVIERFRTRGHHIDAAVEALGGADLIHRIYDNVDRYLTPDTTVVETGGDDPRATYEAVVAALSESPVRGTVAENTPIPNA